MQALSETVATTWTFLFDGPPWALGITGAILCLLNLLMVGAPILAWKLRRQRSSPACIPFFGPALLTMWARVTHKPWWAIPLVWCCDAGTVLVLVSIAWWIRQSWKTSSYTRILGLHATAGNQRATLTIHSTGRYRLDMYWEKMPGSPGKEKRWAQLGNVSEVSGSYLLKPDYGGSKRLELQPDGFFQIAEEQLRSPREHSIVNWRFERDTADPK